MSKYFSRLDSHLKAVDGVNQQTIMGGCLTMVTVLLVIVLIFSEISLFLKIDTVSRMVKDTSDSVNSVKIAYDLEFTDVACSRISFMQEVTRGTVHMPLQDEQPQGAIYNRWAVGRGCRLEGAIVTDKVGGNFRFNVLRAATDAEGKPVQAPAQVQAEGMDLFEVLGKYDHKINFMKFLPTKWTVTAETDATTTLRHDAPVVVGADVAIYQYNLQVVPTQHKTLGGVLTFANQYATSEKQITITELQTHPPIVSGALLKNFQGIVFTYDFSPVMLFKEERREHAIDFLSNLVGIVGGVIAILTLIEGTIHQSTKAIIGKKD